MAASPMPLISARRAGGAEITSAKEPNFAMQLLGQWLDVALRDGAEQHQLQHFIVADRLGTGLPETRAQPLAMAVVVRRRLGKRQPSSRGFVALVRHERDRACTHAIGSRQYNLRDFLQCRDARRLARSSA